MLRIQTSFVSGELSPRLLGRIDFEKYGSGCSELTNFVVLPQGGITNRPGLEYIAESKTSAKRCRLVPFQYSTTQSYILEFGERYIRFYANGGQVTSGGNPVEVQTSYFEEDLPYLRFAQSADVLYICHSKYPPTKLSRTSPTSFSLEAVSWTWPIFNSENTSDVTVTASGTTGNVTLTFSSASFSKGNAGLTNDHVGMYIYLYTYTGSPPVKSDVGLAYIASVTDATHCTATVIKTLPTTSATPYWAESTFGKVYGYPRCVTFYEDRLVFASSTDFPERIWLSKTGDYYNFEYGTNDDSAIARSINSEQVNAIVWMKSAKKLHYGTLGGEGHLSSGGNGALTPTNVTTLTESRYGSPGSVDPVLIGDETLFLQRPGRTLRRYAYNYERDAFSGENLSILAEHLTKDYSITEMAYQQEPYNILWCIRSDGDLLGLTYMPEHKITAWHRHTTDGEFESVATIPGTTDDEIWVVVKRTIGGATKRYIERMKPFYQGGDLEDAFFVDSGLSYDGAATTSITGLTHLAGKSVAVLADGAVVANKTVSAGGAITLPYSASVVHAGLPYTCNMVTMPLVLTTSDGGVVGRKKRIIKTTLRFYDTHGAQISADGTTFDTVHFPLVDNEVTLFTGNKDVSFPGSFDLDAKIHIRQNLPLPFTLLSIMPDVYVDK